MNIFMLQYHCMEDETQEDQIEEALEDDGLLLAWEVPEFTKHDRSARWYVIAGVIALFLIVYALFTANFLFAIIVVMGGIIMFLTAQRDPEMVPFAITAGGIVIGEHFHPYYEFKNFAIIYEPPNVKRLYITSERRARPTFKISLEDMDPNLVREVMITFLPEDLERVEESLTESLARMYKL